MRPDFCGLATFTCFYALLKRVKLLANSSLERQRERAGKVSRSPVYDLTAVVSLANQITRRILTRIMIGLF